MTTPTSPRIAGYLYRGNLYCEDDIVWAVIHADSPAVDSGEIMRRFLVSLHLRDGEGFECTGDLAEAELDTLAALLEIDRGDESFSDHVFPHRVLSSALDPPYPLCETCREPLR